MEPQKAVENLMNCLDDRTTNIIDTMEAIDVLGSSLYRTGDDLYLSNEQAKKLLGAFWVQSKVYLKMIESNPAAALHVLVGMMLPDDPDTHEPFSTN